MYSFIYYYMVKLIEKRNPDPLFGAATFVFLVQTFHVLLFLSIIKVILNLQYPVFSDTYLINKLMMMPLGIVWLLIVNRYYKKRYKTLVKLYEGKKIVTLKNTIIVFSLLLVPLISMILLLKK